MKVGGGGAGVEALGSRRGGRGAGTGARRSGCRDRGAGVGTQRRWAGFLLCSCGRGGSAPPAASAAAAAAAAPGRLLLLLLHRGPLRPAAPGFLLPASGNCEKKKKSAAQPSARQLRPRRPLSPPPHRHRGAPAAPPAGDALPPGRGRGPRGGACEGRDVPAAAALGRPRHRLLGWDPAPREAAPHSRRLG